MGRMQGASSRWRQGDPSCIAQVPCEAITPGSGPDCPDNLPPRDAHRVWLMPSCLAPVASSTPTPHSQNLMLWSALPAGSTRAMGGCLFVRWGAHGHARSRCTSGKTSLPSRDSPLTKPLASGSAARLQTGPVCALRAWDGTAHV